MFTVLLNVKIIFINSSFLLLKQKRQTKACLAQNTQSKLLKLSFTFKNYYVCILPKYFLQILLTLDIFLHIAIIINK